MYNVVSVTVVLVFTTGLMMCHGDKFDMCVEPVCGLSEAQISRALSWPDNKMCGVAVRQECLQDEKIDDPCCIKEQYALIECLKKELFLAQKEENEMYGTHNELSDHQYHISRASKKDVTLNTVFNANKVLDKLALEYEAVLFQRLCNLEELWKLRKKMDDQQIELAELKTKLTEAILWETLKCNLAKIEKYSVYSERCASLMRQVDYLFDSKWWT